MRKPSAAIAAGALTMRQFALGRWRRFGFSFFGFAGSAAVIVRAPGQ
jgi:hypothetical protein